MLIPQPNTKREDKELVIEPKERMKEDRERKPLQDTTDTDAPVTVTSFTDLQGMVWLFTSLDNQYLVTPAEKSYWLYSRQSQVNLPASIGNLLRLELRGKSTYHYDKVEIQWVRIGSDEIASRLIANSKTLLFPPAEISMPLEETA